MDSIIPVENPIGTMTCTELSKVEVYSYKPEVAAEVRCHMTPV